MAITTTAEFFDGRSAASHRITLHLIGEELRFAASDPQADFTWPIAGLQLVHAPDQQTPLRLSHKSAQSARLSIADDSFARILLERLPKTAIRAPGSLSLKLFSGIVAASIFAIILAWAAITYAPASLAALMPASARDNLGDYAERVFIKNRRECTKPAGKRAYLKIGSRLIAPLDNPPNITIRVVDWSIANAFALPGGRLVLTSGLIEKAESADEIAGVLAHELGHAIELHPEAGFIRGLGLQALLSLFTGNGDTLAGTVSLFALLSYSRNAETEADAHAVEIMRKAGIDRRGIIAFFTRILAAQEKLPINDTLEKLSFLSTHPNTKERIADFKNHEDWPHQPVLSTAEWAALRSICRN